MIISIILATVGAVIGSWCAPYLDGAERIIFGIFLFLWIGAMVIIAFIQEKNIKKRIEQLEQKTQNIIEWENLVTKVLKAMADTIQEHDETLEKYSEVGENNE